MPPGRLDGAALAVTPHGALGGQRLAAHRTQPADAERPLDLSDRPMTIAQVDESLGLLSEPRAYGDGLVGREIQWSRPQELPAERGVPRGKRAAAHHDVEEHARGKRDGDHRRPECERTTPATEVPAGWRRARHTGPRRRGRPSRGRT